MIGFKIAVTGVVILIFATACAGLFRDTANDSFKAFVVASWIAAFISVPIGLILAVWI